MDDRPDWFEALADRYRVEKEIGRGGMAHVYRAWDLRFDRWVAIKVLREELALALAQDRFVEEIRLAGRLNHPNIVPLYDAGVIPAAAGRPPLPWFAMMYIEGETLKERLARGPLPVTDAVDVTRAVAAALDYAHERKVVHRDIKPANILMAGIVPVVADFGIARALDRAGGVDTLTAPGLAVGTVQYISPEQAGAEATLDHRGDVYSLGCVAYEMLAGHPPFTGPTAQAIIARHNLDPPPPLGTVRPTVPLAAVYAVEKALAKKPDDRWPSAGAFAHALRETTEHAAVTTPTPAWRRAWWTRRRAATAALALTVVTLGAGYLLADGLGRGDAAAATDTTRYVVFPFTYADTSVPRLGEEEALRGALERWRGVIVEEPFRVRDRLARRGQSVPASGDDALRIAQAFGAGRYVQGTVSRTRDSLRVYATLYDVATRHDLHSKAVVIGGDLRGLDASLRALMDSLLLRGRVATTGEGPVPSAGPEIGSRSLPALQSFSAGALALRAWDLHAADSGFAAALELDDAFGQAALWLAVVRSWRGEPVAAWRWAAQRAELAAARLGSRDSIILAALVARASDDMTAACRQWSDLARGLPRDFTGWYGSGDCLRSDRLVLQDAGSPTGWRFRTSYWSALKAFEVAFTLLPSVHRALRSGGFSAVRDVFLTDPNGSRGGRSLSGLDLAGVAFWQADSLLVIPFRLEDLGKSLDPSVAFGRSRGEATRNLRLEFLRIARGWVAAFPGSSEALEALANGMAMLGDPAASDSLARARKLTADPVRALELAAQEVWLHLGTGLTGDLPAIRRAAALADSLLVLGALERSSPGLAAGLAALTGRTPGVAGLIRRGGLEVDSDPPEFLRLVGPSLWTYASLGGPADSVEVYWSRVATAIETNLPPGDRRAVLGSWLGRAAAMVYPDHLPSGAPLLVKFGQVIPSAFVALARGDSTAARSALGQYHRDPADRATLAITPDVLPSEAALHWQLGDTAVAVGMLDASLADVGPRGPTVMSSPFFSAGAVRALLLRAAMDRLRGRRDGFSERAGRLLWSKSAQPVDDVIRQYLEVLQ